MKVKYTGNADVRTIDARSFKDLENIEGVGKIGKSAGKKVWNGNGDVQDLDQKTARALVQVHGDEFEIVDDADIDEDDESLDDESSDDDGNEESPELGEGSPVDRGTPAP